ncbi:14752_t:CDS:2 [Entrophospora sp. SA101]|nr:14752_t:CDS:2 [Entrophospora sp. SA101]
MWELETVDQGRHILRIGENAASINSLLKLILVLTSLFEAIILPVLLSLVWISIYKIKQRMNSNDFKLCMVATHGYVLRLSSSDIKDYPRGENFALVANSTTIQNIMRNDYVQNTYWGLNNTLYAVRSKIDAGSCSLSIGDGVGVISSNNLGNETDTPTNTRKYTSSYSGHTPTIKNVGLISYMLNTFLRWLYDSGYTHDQRLDRYCTILMEYVKSNNTIEKLEELISTNVQDTDINGKWFGESLVDSVVDKLTSMLTTWRNDIKYKRSESSYNFFDQFGDTISQSLASSIQSMISTVSVDVDKKEIFTAPGLWIELTALIFAILLTCLISMTVLTARNSKMSLPLSVLDFEIISNAIFKEYNDDGSYNQKISWPFNVVYLQDKSYRLISTNESADD